ncbi:MAG: TolC family protein, partial [Janthinobacterium sp.]
MYRLSVSPCALARGKLTGIVLSLFVGAAQAADAPSLAALLQQSETQAPALLEQAATVRAAGADARQARAWANPSLGYTGENLGAPKMDGVSQRQDTYTLTQVFEIGGKRSARIEAEQRKADAVGARERQIRIAFANELAVAYATAEAMQLRKQVADAELARANDDFRATTALVQAGREAQLRLAQARASVSAAEAAVQSAVADATDALERLSAVAGADQPYTGISHPFLDHAIAPRSDQRWTTDASPALASARAESDALTAQVRMEQKRWVPDVGVSAGMRKFGWSNERAAIIGVNINIPLFDRNQHGVTAARERASAAEQRVEAARLEAQATHRAAQARVVATERRLQAAEQGETA